MSQIFKIDCYEDYSNVKAKAEKIANSRKANAPLFIYMILEKQTDRKHPMRQSELLSRLAKMPYEVELERKALGRHLQSLSRLDMGIHNSPKGYYYEDELLAARDDEDVS